MHDSVRKWVRSLTNRLPLHGDAIEVGSYDENGSVRMWIEPFCDSYLGTDMRWGPGVDAQIDATKLLDQFQPRSFDVVVSTEMLEHAIDWKLALFNLKQLVADGGFLILTTRGPGFPRHAYPDDYWRFDVELMRKVMADMRMTDVVADTDPKSPGVFVLCVGPSQVQAMHEDPSLWHEAEEAPE